MTEIKHSVSFDHHEYRQDYNSIEEFENEAEMLIHLENQVYPLLNLAPNDCIDTRAYDQLTLWKGKKEIHVHSERIQYYNHEVEEGK